MTETQRNDAEIEELCEILIGLDRERLRAALRRLEDRGAFTELQSRTLADAMRLALANDPAFADGMGTLIGKGVHATVQRDSAAFGRALAPAMGPAIRNAVRLMLQNFISSIEATVDRVGTEHHQLAGRAKDIGSASVFLAISLALLVWALVLLPRYL